MHVGFTVLGGILGALLAGLLLGVFNGCMITRFVVPPFVATLAMLTIARGMTMLYTRGIPISNLGPGMEFIGSGWILGIPVPVWISLIVVLVLLNVSPFWQQVAKGVVILLAVIIDPYFSATKLLWLLQNDPALKKRVEAGEISFGTVDCWILFRLSGGAYFRTDHTNACRTLLFNIHSLKWDREILELWGLGHLRLPGVNPSAFDHGQSDFEGLFSKPIPIQALIGDSHAAAFGEGLIFGATREHIVRAALESIPYQRKDVMNAMQQDLSSPLLEMAVNGGMAQNAFILSYLSNLLEVRRTNVFDNFT